MPSATIQTERLIWCTQQCDRFYPRQPGDVKCSALIRSSVFQPGEMLITIP
jgi:hypothetical protein